MYSPRPAFLSLFFALCLPRSLTSPSQSAPIIPIYLLPWLYITIYHLSSLCCPPSHYLLCLFYSPWHTSLSLSLFRRCLVFLSISLEFFSPTGWVNKPAWFHQCESVSLIRRDPDGISGSFYTAIHQDHVANILSLSCGNACQPSYDRNVSCSFSALSRKTLCPA